MVTFDASPLAATFTAGRAGRDFVLGGPLTPDQIVYAGSWPLLLDLPDGIEPDAVPDLLRERLAHHIARHGAAPIIVVVPRLGLFAAGASFDAADTARHVYLDALRVGDGALRLGGVRPLADAERSFIEAWEAEAYRRNVAAGPRGTGRFTGKVALVTGAAQGFGLAIAADLVAEGGHVILADLNEALAASNARDLEARHGPGRATAIAMNVMDESSVADGFHATVVRFGGLDVLVSNAGVLRAGAVTSQPLAEFDLVTRVNYRGYFLGVRSAAPIMARQHRAKPDCRGDIIEINSKSGLVGSSRNSAYAGSKFGGIGLTQSFALELVDDGDQGQRDLPGQLLRRPPVGRPGERPLRPVPPRRQGARRDDDRRRPPLLRGQGPDGPRLHAGRRAGGPLLPGRPAVRDRPGPAGHRRPGDAELRRRPVVPAHPDRRRPLPATRNTR